MTESPQIKTICHDEFSSIDQRIGAVCDINSVEELYLLLNYYNWDDGFEVPHAIADHPLCDLAVAQRLYWLASASEWFRSEKEPSVYEQSWYDFSNKIIRRLLNGSYKVSNISHSEKFNRVSLYYFKKQNIPEILFRPVVGKNG